MEYTTIAEELLRSYSISAPVIEFIRHNENITLKITDGVTHKNYLLRIHNPSIEGLFGLQHTLEGIQAEIKILQELNQKGLIDAQKTVANNLGTYITECSLSNFNHPCYATLLEWIEGSTLTLKEDNINEITFTLGKNLARFHRSLKEFKPSDDFIRPIYDIDRIDQAIDELNYCVEVNLFSMEQYDTIKKVLLLVKEQMNELSKKEDTFGLIHADVQLGNVVVNNGNPVLIDLGFCGFGSYYFDLGSAVTIFPSELRPFFLQGYSSESSFSTAETRYIEGQIFMDTFISYVMFMRDDKRNGWIKQSASKLCNTICKDFLAGEEVLYLF